MPIAFHPVHRRLAELTVKANRLGGFDKLPLSEQREVEQCVKVNADLVVRLDHLKGLAFQAHCVGDMEWRQDICQQIEDLEAKMK